MEWKQYVRHNDDIAEMDQDIPDAVLGDIFLVIAPGLVQLAEEEFRYKWQAILDLAGFASDGFRPEPEIYPEAAGITLRGLSEELGYLLNQCLKIPTRVLLRLKAFRCRDFPKLYNRVKKIDWKPYFPDGAGVQIRVSAHASRLMHHKRIGKTVSEALQSSSSALSSVHQLSPDESEKDSFQLFVRFHHDMCTISLDTTGEALYRRWPGKKTGEAPIRETLAAAMFWKMQQVSGRPSGALSVIDPMAGSGTFLLEAATFWRVSGRRDYDFLKFPSQAANLQYFSDKRGQQLLPQPELDLKGFDQSHDSVQRSVENFQRAAQNIRILQQDLFCDEKETSCDKEDHCDWVFVNPPYGVRLETGEIFPYYYKRVLKKILERWNPELIAMIVPSSQLKRSFRVPFEYQLLQRLSFLNGGLRVCLLLLCKTDQKAAG